MWSCKESLWASLSEPNFSYHSIVYTRSFIFTFWASLVHCVPPFASYQWSTSSRKKNVGPDTIQSHTLCRMCFSQFKLYLCNLKMGTDITCKKGSQVAGLNFETATNFLKVYSILACTDVSEQARRVCGKWGKDCSLTLWTTWLSNKIKTLFVLW